MGEMRRGEERRGEEKCASLMGDLDVVERILLGRSVKEMAEG
jgi:hypothetical protein